LAADKEEPMPQKMVHKN